MAIVIQGKKSFKGQVVVGGITIDWRAKWSSEWQEWRCNVKGETEKRYSDDREYCTNEAQDAADTLWSMASELAGSTTRL